MRAVKENKGGRRDRERRERLPRQADRAVREGLLGAVTFELRKSCGCRVVTGGKAPGAAKTAIVAAPRVGTSHLYA